MKALLNLVSVFILAAMPIWIHFDSALAKAIDSDTNKVEQKDEPKAAPNAELLQAIQAYKTDINATSCAHLLQVLQEFLSKNAQVKPEVLIKQNPCLNDLSTKVIYAGAAKIWTFPGIQQSQIALVQLVQQVSIKVKHQHAVIHTQIKMHHLVLPTGVILKDARFMPMPIVNEKTNKKEKASFLICSGVANAANGIWLSAYKLTADGFKESNEPLSCIPPFLASNISGIVSFNGSDLVMTVKPATVGADGNLKLAEPSSADYKLVLRLTNGKFMLEGKPIEDTPYYSAYQFVHAIEEGHFDLAKAWLIDPSLVSIPKYIGVAHHTSSINPRIINMASSPAGNFRYRLVTFEKYDLIIDVAKYKGKWAVKALFIAPPDPILQKIARSLPAQV